MDDTFRNLAAFNGGYLHRAHVLELGGSDAMLAFLCATKVLRRIRVGTYVFRDEFDRLDPVEQHLVIARAVIDKFDPGTVALSHHSAAAAHGLALFDADLTTVHLTRLDGGSGRVQAGIVHHDARPDDVDIALVDGRMTVSPRRAVWEVACTTTHRGALVVMDSALHHELLDRDVLLEAGETVRHWPRSRFARLVARQADGGAANPGESLLRFLCVEHRLPRPATQVEVRDRDGLFVARTDLGWPELRHYAEFDGFRKYWRDLRPGEDPSAVVVREKVREDKVRGLENGMSRAVWTEVVPEGARATAQRIEFDLEQSHRLYARGRRHFA